MNGRLHLTTKQKVQCQNHGLYDMQFRVYHIRMWKDDNAITKLISEESVFNTNINILQWTCEQMIKDLEKGD